MKATPTEKRLIVATITDSIAYCDGKLTVKLKPIFDSLRQLKNANILELNSVKGRTREKLSNSEIAGILTQNITESLKIKGRTLKPLIVSNKKDPEGSNLLNGASNGLNFEPGVNYIVKFAHLCLHDEETIEQVKNFLNNTVDSVS